MTTDSMAAYASVSKQAIVLGVPMHYMEQGTGDPILFLHGIPTSSYLWRNVTPYLAEEGRCIALDLIGMGGSAKPDIEYTVFDHIRYVEAFIDALQLRNITLVLHAWGSVIGFDIAMRRPELFKGIAFLESQVRPMSEVSMIPLPMQELLALAGPEEAVKKLILESTFFVDKMIPAGTLHQMGEEEMSHYREPFLQPGTRKPLWQFVVDLPKGNEKTPVVELIARYSSALQQSSIPKLMMYAIPGYNTSIDTVQWVKEHFPNVSIADIDEGFHYPQEYNPEKIGKVLRHWYQEKVAHAS